MSEDIDSVSDSNSKSRKSPRTGRSRKTEKSKKSKKSAKSRKTEKSKKSELEAGIHSESPGSKLEVAKSERSKRSKTSQDSISKRIMLQKREMDEESSFEPSCEETGRTKNEALNFGKSLGNF
jgi:hypothetical protein